MKVRSYNEIIFSVLYKGGGGRNCFEKFQQFTIYENRFR